MKCDKLYALVKTIELNDQPVPVDYTARLVANGYDFSSQEGEE